MLSIYSRRLRYGRLIPSTTALIDFYQLKLRLGSLLDQKRLMQAQQTPAAKLSSRYIALEEGFRQFSNDLSKLQVRRACVALPPVG
jgi:hypothetical protein